MNIDKIFTDNREWVANKLNEDENYFKELSEGQDPQLLYIGCSDSRVTAEELLGAKPGDVFVHRNIANMVSNLDLSAMSVIEYSVVHLNVKDIVVCGHYNCGGVAAAMDSKDLGILNPWLRSIRDVYRLHTDELNSIDDEQNRYDRLVELNVQEQCINVVKNASVQRAIRNNKMTIHGWVFDMRSGGLVDLKIDFKKITESIREVYHLD